MKQRPNAYVFSSLLVFQNQLRCWFHQSKSTKQIFFLYDYKVKDYYLFNHIAASFFNVFKQSHTRTMRTLSKWSLCLFVKTPSFYDTIIIFWHSRLSKVYLVHFIPWALHCPYPQESPVSLKILEARDWAFSCGFVIASMSFQ